MKQTLPFAAFALLVVSALSLSGCEMALPSRMNTAKIELRSKMETQVFNTAHPAAVDIDHLAADYRKRGEGPVKLIVVYDPLTGQASSALAQGQALRQRLIMAGLGKDIISVGAVPARDGLAKGQTIATYHALEAAAPQSCEGAQVPGSEGAVSSVELYAYGCHTADMTARQVARPGDLLGREATGAEGTARRQAGVVEPYNTGEPAEPLEGLQASGLGESGGN